MPETKRAIRPVAALDGVSDHLGEVLRRADELLVEWSRFGAEVRTQVEREAGEVGRAVATAVDGAVARAASASVERALTDQIGAKLTALATEISKLEQRTRAASRAVGEERRGDRRVLWGLGAGILIANGLLVAMLLRQPAAPVQLPAPAAEPARVELPAAAPADAITPEPAITIDAISGPAASSEPAAVGSGSAQPAKVGKDAAHLPRKK
jgi:hypothetical protein